MVYVPRLSHGLLLTMTTLVATGVATAAVAHDRGWSIPMLSKLDRPDEPTSVTVVLKRNGGDVFAASDDSPTLALSGILHRQGIARTTIPPFSGTDAQWHRFVHCVQDRFDGYAVDVVDEVPTEGAYTVAYIGGTPDLLGYEDTVGGIAPHADRVLPGSVLFVFQPKGIALRALCDTTAHEIGHTLGLDHSRDCTDLMSYETCGEKEFRVEPARCGEWEDRDCESGHAHQSAHAHLATAVGLRPRTQAEPAPPPPPRVAARPTIEVRRSARAEVGQPFSIEVDVGTDTARQVDLFWYARRGHRLRCGETNPSIDFSCERRGTVYTFTLDPNRPGPRKFNVRVTEADGRTTKTSTYRVRFNRAH